jgi:hypothetical protein
MMTSTARLLCVMGSGETAPTMVPVHADLMSRVGSPPGKAVMLDTPYGFQENATEISAKAIGYFRVNVGHPLEVASMRDSETAEPLAVERVHNQLRDAGYIFAGPGSPSYALQHWRGSRIPELICDRLTSRGCVTFASAAATSLGRLALPVYEIYKVGEKVHWLEGLDLLAGIGLDFVVIPHYDNGQGGTHDTRYCFMGETRLRLLEEQLPGGLAILGVAEHTAAIFDLDAGTLEVRGRGFVAVRRAGVEHRFEPGPPVELDNLQSGAGAATHRPDAAGSGEGDAPGSPPVAAPLLEDAYEHRRTFEEALDRMDSDAAVVALLELDERLAAWATDTLESDELDRGRSVLRGMVVRLGEISQTGLSDPRQTVGPYVDLLLRLREEARRERRYADADLVRTTLTDLGVEVHDSPAGPEWTLTLEG